ncbi:MAG: hypothetical protein KDH09_18885 [Chrysiogenetes bacterium]|nr:hypothetical protein [Chrysiogenetes bacterium]
MNLSGLDQFFALCAAVGGALFVVQLFLQFVVGHDSDGLDADFDGDVDADFDDGGHDGADKSFKLLSLQGMTAFFMMFGLVGLALHRQSLTTEPVAVAGGTLAGLGTTWIMGRLFNFMKGMQSSGTMKMSDAIGREGSVYLGIPEGGTGKVQVSVSGHLSTFDAISDNKSAIETGSAVRVVRVVNEHVLVVEPV